MKWVRTRSWHTFTLANGTELSNEWTAFPVDADADAAEAAAAALGIPVQVSLTDPDEGVVEPAPDPFVRASVLAATFAERTLLTTASPYAASTATTGTVQMVGRDHITGRQFYTTGLYIWHSDDYGTTRSATGRAWPANVSGNDARKVLRFGNYVWLLAKDGTTGLWGVYRSLPDTGSGYTWSAQLLTFSKAGTLMIGTCMNADAAYLYVGEYGDPAGGPAAYRISLADANGAGTNFTSMWSDAVARHMHGVFPDPYQPGHVYMTLGDGTTTNKVRRSTDYGATWTTILNWQTVQVSFTDTHLYCAADNSASSGFRINRATGNAEHLATNWHYNMPVPGGAAGARFYQNAFYGTVDPATGIFYFTAQDNSSPGNTYGLFYIAQPGGRVELLESGVTYSGEMFVAGGRLHWHGYWRPLLTLAA